MMNLLKNQKKIERYYKYYTQLDKEIKTQTRLYSLNTAQYHILKQKKKRIKFMNKQWHI